MKAISKRESNIIMWKQYCNVKAILGAWKQYWNVKAILERESNIGTW